MSDGKMQTVKTILIEAMGEMLGEELRGSRLLRGEASESASARNNGHSG